MLKNGLKKNRREGEYILNYGKIMIEPMSEYEFLDMIEDHLFMIKHVLLVGEEKHAIFKLGTVIEKLSSRLAEFEQQDDCDEFKKDLCCRCQAP
ncbi:MAG: hypothetical protein Q8876_05660 [Bacillota bacterium]|nr:hypothetical protein [Bacillota bacterium]